MTFWQGVLGKETAEERVKGKGKTQKSTKAEEKPNEREKEDTGDKRKRIYGAYSILTDLVVGNKRQHYGRAMSMIVQLWI